MKWIFLALALGQAALCSETKKPDALATLEQNPSSSATERVGKMYRASKDPYARLWLVEALYTRVQQYQDEKALEILAEASKDKSPDVRRKAIAGLEAVRFLPPGRLRESWIAKIDGIARGAGKDAAAGVRSAGVDLRTSSRSWQEKESKPQTPPQNGAGDFFSHWMAGAMPQVFVWVVCLQLIGYFWHKLGMSVLSNLGPTGTAVIEAIAVFEKRPQLLAFPLLTGLLLLPTLGLSLAWTLATASIPSSDPVGLLHSCWLALAIYAAAGLACFLPALILMGKLVGGLKASLVRIVALAGLAELALVLWPFEPLLRLAAERRRKDGVFAWIFRTGAPFAAILAGGIMVKERLGLVAALQAAAKRFRAAEREPGAELWGRAPFQPGFVLWCLASPVLFSLSVLPAMALGFKPTQLFGLWFLSNIQFAVGFGWWAGVLLSVSAFGQLMILGAVKGAQLHLEVERS